ncbi:NmrA/HSCARG family protein [Burkholderia lata]|uniref:NmrA family transcriptional regulator n=1 Tax=Burkholderia lata (strain ATCC 17760 / DSM 23089 / LMG 22485 / NCIMB 9086 / R18194 / 383) TaxID=482957 RepID=A0A6P2RUM6_BURL3|nr:NmrA/HSCARG family protein [Burkholderia lata]VWC35902.1 NmrA family transcriptional regulator [Burkholderia lata]
MTFKTIVVLGATGQQGGAVVRSLKADGHWYIRALSRNPNSIAAKQLAADGIEVVAADLEDPASLRTAFAGALGVFSVQGSEQGAAVETRRGIAAADAALAAGVQHFIYASVGGADRRSGVPHFESKRLIEEHILRIGLPASIVRPVFFMENFSNPVQRTVLLALLRSYVPKTKSLQMIAVADIGNWVAQAFTRPGDFLGKAEEIAGVELTRAQIVSTFKNHGWSVGLPFPLPRFIFRPLPYDFRKMFAWFGEAGYLADIPALRARQPDVLTLEKWLVEQGDASRAGKT